MDIGILVFREGLECILVLAAITANMTGSDQVHRRPVAIGAGMALFASSNGESSRQTLLWGLIPLGFTSLYREGFEVVLFLQSYNLRLGGGVVLRGALLGLSSRGWSLSDCARSQTDD